MGIGKLLKEPLLHFLALGGLLFAGYAVMERREPEPGTIVLTRGQLESLETGFRKAFERAPTTQELAGLVGDRIREEVYYREALALGLDKDDTVIRRRLRQKMEFVSEDLAAQVTPTEAELVQYLRAHPEDFREPPQLSFTQLYLGQAPAPELARLLRSLRSLPADAPLPVAANDALMLDASYTAVGLDEAARVFGVQFADSLTRLPVGEWQGPVSSGYGIHAVRIDLRSPGRLPSLAEIRPAVEREWSNAKRQHANEQIYRGMLARYRVIIDEARPDNRAPAIASVP